MKPAVEEKLSLKEELEIRLGNLLYSFIEEHNLPLVYRDGEPKAVIIDLKLLEALLEKLDEIEEREMLSDPEAIKSLQEGQADYMAGRVLSQEEALEELGLKGEL